MKTAVVYALCRYQGMAPVGGSAMPCHAMGWGAITSLPRPKKAVKATRIQTAADGSALKRRSREVCYKRYLPAEPWTRKERKLLLRAFLRMFNRPLSLMCFVLG